MKFKNMLLGLSLVTGLLLVGCQSTESKTNDNSSTNDTFRVAMVTDQNGVDDRSFNQSAWEGLEDWAENHNFSDESIRYYQSGSETNYIPHLNSATHEAFDIIYAIGYTLQEALTEVAQQNPNQRYGMLDGHVDLPNVVSISFADNEASYLAGMAAAYMTTTNRIGFIGGQRTPNIEKFQAGYEAGAKAVNPSIEVDAQYIETYSDAGVAQQAAGIMYANNTDVIFHAAGSAGNGVNTEARNRLESGANEDIWVIGVDRDQSEEGEWEGGNFILTSTLKELGRAAENEANDSMEGNFHGGQLITSNLASGGVGIVKNHLPDELKEIIEEAEQDIIDGEIIVPEEISSE